MINIRRWTRTLLVVPVAVGLSACSVETGGGEQTAESRQALVAPTSVSGFALVASGRVTVQDRTHVIGGDVGAAAGTGDAINTATDVRLAVGRGSIGSRIVLGDRTQAGNVFVNTLVAPAATVASQNAFSAPPALPSIPTFTAGTTNITVNGTETRAAGNFGTVTVNGTLNLSGGTYNIANITLGPDGAIVATGPSVVRVAGRVSGADRSRLVGNANAGALRLFVAGANDTTGGVVLGNDTRLTALVVSRAQFRAGDRFIASGAVAASNIVLAHDSRFTFNTGFACSTNASCNDNNDCTVDACVASVCQYTNRPNGTTCSDGNACTSADSCQAGACVPGAGVVCNDNLFCTGTETCNPATGCVAGTPPSSNDGVTCTVDACNESTDQIDHTPNNGLCPSGFACNATAGCVNIDECAAGTDNCDANATCTDTQGSFTCTCNPGFTGDGTTCVQECRRITVAPGVERCVIARQDGTVDLYLDPNNISTPWEQLFDQTDPPGIPEGFPDSPPYENGCGPVAGRNLLFWYGMDPGTPDDETWQTIGGEMQTNGFDNDFLYDKCCPDEFGIPNPTCALQCTILVDVLIAPFINLGSHPDYVIPTLDAHVPPGYARCNENRNLSLPQLQWSLSRGNPVYILGSSSSFNLHWALVTGIYKQGNDFWVRIANLDNDLTFADLEHYRTLNDLLVPDVLNGLMEDKIGVRPFAIRYAKVEDMLPGNVCDDWHSNDLTGASGGPTTGSSSIVGYADNLQHVVTIGDDSKIHEHFFTNQWNHSNLSDVSIETPPLAASGSALAAYVTSFNGQQHVNFLSDAGNGSGNVNELFFDPIGQDWHWNNLTARAPGAPTSHLSSPLVSYVSPWNSQQHVFYVTDNGHIHELFFVNNAWNHSDLTQASGSPPSLVPGKLVGFVTTGNSQQHVVYLAQSNGHVHELVFVNNQWIGSDLTAQARALNPATPDPKVGSSLAGYETTFGFQQQHINFVGPDNHVHELLFNAGQWTWSDLFVAAGMPNGAPATGALHGYTTTNGRQHVNFVSSNGHVYELWHAPNQWHFKDLSAAAVPIPPTARLTSMLTGYQSSNGEEHVNFIAADGRVYELFL